MQITWVFAVLVHFKRSLKHFQLRSRGLGETFPKPDSSAGTSPCVYYRLHKRPAFVGRSVGLAHKVSIVPTVTVCLCVRSVDSGPCEFLPVLLLLWAGRQQGPTQSTALGGRAVRRCAVSIPFTRYQRMDLVRCSLC